MEGKFTLALGGTIEEGHVDGAGARVITRLRVTEFSLVPGDPDPAPYVPAPARGSDPAIREALAAYAHAAWAGWMDYLFSKCIDTGFSPDDLLLPAEFVRRWKRQMHTAYADLPEDEKESDRLEADRMLAIVTGATDGE